jgi:hypothetical protein
MSETQFQKPNTNIFAFVNMQGEGGKLLFYVETVEYNPETEENKLISNQALGVDEFALWLKKDKWIVS